MLISGPRIILLVSFCSDNAEDCVGVVLVGDEQLAKWDVSSDSLSSHTATYYEDGCTLARAIKLASDNIDTSTRVLTIVSFHQELVDEQKTYAVVAPKSAPDRAIKQVEDAMNEWSKLYPRLQVVWILPHKIDFIDYNLKKACTATTLSIVEKRIMVTSHTFAAEFDALVLNLKTLLNANKYYVIDFEETLDLIYVDGFHLDDLSNEKISLKLNKDIKSLLNNARSTGQKKDCIEEGMLK